MKKDEKLRLKSLESIEKHSRETDDSEQIYNHLKKTYTDKEIADAFIFDMEPSLSIEEEKEFSKFIKENKRPKGSLGWPGGVNFPKWAIDIIMFINLSYYDNPNAKEEDYNKIDKSLMEMTKFIETHK